MEWLADDGGAVRKGQPVCVVETTKAAIELVSPADGTLRRLYEEGREVELGERVAVVAESEAELAALDAELAAAPAPEPAPAAGAAAKATRKAVELAERHGIDLSEIAKPGFITAEDVEAHLAARAAPAADAENPLLRGIAVEHVSLPASLALGEDEGRLDEAFLAELRADPDAFRELPEEERVHRYRRAGARIGEGVRLGAWTLLDAPRIVLGDGVELGAESTIRCEETVAIGELTMTGPRFELLCRRAFIGAGGYIGRNVRIGGGGHADPQALFAAGDLLFLGDEAFVNACRPVLVGREVFVTMRSAILTHNIGHSLLEGFENRFAPVVLEDRAQVGIGTVVYAGCRIGREAIVASNSYVVSDVPAGKLAIGVPARVAGEARRELTDARRAELGARMLEELRELVAGRGHEVAPLEGGFEVAGAGRVFFVERLGPETAPAAGDGETVVMTLRLDGEPPAGVAVLDLLARRAHGPGGRLADSVREFARKRGIRLEPGPWRYRGGLV